MLRFFATRLGVAVLALLVLLPLLLLLAVPPLLQQEPPPPRPSLLAIAPWAVELTPDEVLRLQQYVLEVQEHEPLPRYEPVLPERERVATPKPGDLELLACAERHAVRPRGVVNGSRERPTHCPGL